MSRRSRRRTEPEDQYSETLSKVFELNDGGRYISTLFLDIPSASLYPDYRDIVEAPISLAEIKKRTRLKAYDNEDEFFHDFEQMAINAGLYNGQDSPVVDDALFMLNFVLSAFGKPPSEMSLVRQQTQLLQELIDYKYKGRVLAESFMVLPSESEAPGYYDTIKSPVSFAEIEAALKKEPYASLEEFEEAVAQIFANAMEFNQEGTVIYSDAKSLQRQLHNRVAKLEKLNQKFSVSVSASESDEEMDLEPVQYNRFEDDDDDDFEAKEQDDDDDEDDEPEESEEPQLPQKRIIVRDEIVKRPKGSSARDAMVQLVTCASVLHHSVLHTMHYGARGDKPQIPPAYAKDMVQIRVSASKTDCFTSFAATLPSYHHTLTLTVYLHDRMRMLPHSLTVLLNGRKLQTTTVGEGLREEYEIRLSPGLNQVTVAAIGPDSAGTVRPFGPPPIVGAEPDEERMLLWLNLSR